MLKEDSSSNTVRYLIEATPDINMQVRGRYIDGVFLPHFHLGHVNGLLYFGREGPDASSLNVYCGEHVEDFLMKNDPYRYLVDRNNIEIHNFKEGDAMDIQGGQIAIKEHDHQLQEKTTAYIVEGEEKTLYYLSDISELTEDIKEAISDADIAIIDGTFYSDDEIDRYEEVPHPTIEKSMDQLEDFDTEILFTHLNHTNPALREGSEERQEVEDRGFQIAEAGMEFEI